MSVTVHDDLLVAARAAATTPAWQADYRQHRPMVERTLAWLVNDGHRSRPLPRDRS